MKKKLPILVVIIVLLIIIALFLGKYLIYSMFTKKPVEISDPNEIAIYIN